ncbi:MAG: hypothetical protein ACYCYP_04565 [Leptospirales bacterium]
MRSLNRLARIWWGLAFLWVLFLPERSFAYMPRYVHVTLGVPWVAYLVFLLGVLAPIFLYLGVSWYWRHEIEANKFGKDDISEE